MGPDGGTVRPWADRIPDLGLVVGRSMPEDGGSRDLGYGHDREPERRVVGMLRAQGACRPT